MKPTLLRLLAGLAAAMLLCGCNDESSPTITVGRVMGPRVTSKPDYGGDMDLKRAKLNLDLRPDSAYDSKHTAGIAGRFDTGIDQFNTATRITITGAIADDDGFGAQASQMVAPTKLNKKGTRLAVQKRKYSTSNSIACKHANPITRMFKMSCNQHKGRIDWALTATPQDVGNDDINWMQYYGLLQSLFGGKQKNEGVYNGKLTIRVTGYSSKLCAVISETHVITGPVGFYSRNGKLKIAEVKR
jgi:hypothetical protein